MNHAIGLGALVAVTLGASVAWAEDPRVSRVYDDSGLDRPHAIAREVAAMEKACAVYESMSRMGPDPRDIARCEQAVSRVERRGPAAAGVLLAAVDRSDQHGWYVKQRVYQLIGKSGDAELVEPLVRGLARIATRKLERDDEIAMIEDALTQLTHASPGARVPWDDEAPDVADREKAVARVFDWRLWQEQHEGVSHAELAARGLEQARANLASEDPRQAYQGVTHLLRYAPEEGLLAAKRVLDGNRLPAPGLGAVTDAVSEVELFREEAEARRIAEAEEAAENQASKRKPKSPRRVSPAQPPPAAPPAQKLGGDLES